MSTVCDSRPDKIIGKRQHMLPEGSARQLRSVDLSDLRLRRWWKPVLSSLYVHSVAYTAMAGTIFALNTNAVLGLISGFFFSLVLAPLYRGLENLVHGASHGDILGNSGVLLGIRRQRLNDVVGDWIAALPVGQRVSSFRERHVKDHHVGFDTDEDPCQQRMLRHTDTIRGNLPSLKATLLQLPREAVAFYRGSKSGKRTAMAGFSWHIVFLILPFSLLFGLKIAGTAWIIIFMPLFLLTLPAVRAVAESGEHDYRPISANLSIIERTFEHRGLGNRVIHLFGDDLHPEHHLWIGIPQYHLREARRRALPYGLSSVLRGRTAILGPVETSHVS